MGSYIRAATRFYRALLVLYPARFRREYGPLMVAAFEKMCEEVAAEGGLGALVGLWWRTLLDLTTSVLVERLDEKGRWMMSRHIWFLWILASIAGWLAAGWVLLPASQPLTIPVGGALVSVLHVILLQRYVARAGWWRLALPLKAGSWLLPLALFAMFPWQQLSGPLFFGALLSTLLLSAAVVGSLQGFALRPLLSSSWRWAVVPAAGLIASAAVGLALFNILLPLAANLATHGTFSLALPAGFISPLAARQMGALLPLLHLLIAVIIGGIYGMVTGVAFVIFRGRNRGRGATALV